MGLLFVGRRGGMLVKLAEVIALCVLSATVLEASAGNLLPYTFENLDEEKLPDGWTIRKMGKNPELAKVSVEKDETGANVVKVALPQEASVRLDTPSFSLNPDEDYIFVMQVKVEDMHYTGHWYGDGRAVISYVFGKDGKKHTAFVIHGEGSTDGWVTGILPFPRKDERQYFSRVRVSLFCIHMSGTVYYRNPLILKRPAGFDIRRSFELEDGTLVNGHLQLFR